MEEPAPPRAPRGAHLDAATREDLDAYGVAELNARILRLQGEVERTRAALGRKQSGRQAADALFSIRRG
ncbi:DUF1192 domain-containing protein [Caulobacter sp. S45]|uniref:DUF1192 domain-containing protein n=1 Tax=Caulobacter sp. S45 TaxID=1641861 RepID=UPI0015750414|nr:DUF1192 domain-containing protein [Caulobacter sp. S45]